MVRVRGRRLLENRAHDLLATLTDETLTLTVYVVHRAVNVRRDNALPDRAERHRQAIPINLMGLLCILMAADIADEQRAVNFFSTRRDNLDLGPK